MRRENTFIRLNTVAYNCLYFLVFPCLFLSQATSLIGIFLVNCQLLLKYPIWVRPWVGQWHLVMSVTITLIGSIHCVFGHCCDCNTFVWLSSVCQANTMTNNPIEYMHHSSHHIKCYSTVHFCQSQRPNFWPSMYWDL